MLWHCSYLIHVSCCHSSDFFMTHLLVGSCLRLFTRNGHSGTLDFVSVGNESSLVNDQVVSFQWPGHTMLLLHVEVASWADYIISESSYSWFKIHFFVLDLHQLGSGKKNAGVNQTTLTVISCLIVKRSVFLRPTVPSWKCEEKFFSSISGFFCTFFVWPFALCRWDSRSRCFPLPLCPP